MRSNVAALTVAIAVLIAPLAGQSGAVFAPIDVRVPTPPRSFVGGGATHLVYELHVTNLSSRRVTLETVDVMDRAASSDLPPLLHLEGAALEAALRVLGPPPRDSDRRVLPAGGTALVFVWVTVRQDAVPAAVTHRFAVRFEDAEAPPQSGQAPAAPPGSEIMIRGVDVAVATDPTPVIGPPLEGDHWLAANGPGNEPDHRRTLLAPAGEGRIAQRFAIDWVRLFDDGRTFRGDPRDNSSYRAFGAKVLAVSDGIVRETLDGVPENVPDAVIRAVPITPATVSGNYVLLDLGNGAFAVYAHLQPGSLTVRKGDRVRQGQKLALVGNTGNSSEPHLHFHIADRPAPLDAEGIPYALDAFEVEAEPEVVTPAMKPLGDSLEIGGAVLARMNRRSARRPTREIPLLNTIVTFVAR